MDSLLGIPEQIIINYVNTCWGAYNTYMLHRQTLAAASAAESPLHLKVPWKPGLRLFGGVMRRWDLHHGPALYTTGCTNN